MKTLVAVILGVALALSANVATAYVVVVGAAIPITPAVAEDGARLGDAVRAAIRDVLAHAIAFTPTVVLSSGRPAHGLVVRRSGIVDSRGGSALRLDLPPA
jgi:hypothetical protein